MQFLKKIVSKNESEYKRKERLLEEALVDETRALNILLINTHTKLVFYILDMLIKAHILNESVFYRTIFRLGLFKNLKDKQLYNAVIRVFKLMKNCPPERNHLVLMGGDYSINKLFLREFFRNMNGLNISQVMALLPKYESDLGEIIDSSDGTAKWYSKDVYRNVLDSLLKYSHIKIDTMKPELFGYIAEDKDQERQISFLDSICLKLLEQKSKEGLDFLFEFFMPLLPEHSKTPYNQYPILTVFSTHKIFNADHLIKMKNYFSDLFEKNIFYISFSLSAKLFISMIENLRTTQEESSLKKSAHIIFEFLKWSKACYRENYYLLFNLVNDDLQFNHLIILMKDKEIKQDFDLQNEFNALNEQTLFQSQNKLILAKLILQKINFLINLDSNKGSFWKKSVEHKDLIMDSKLINQLYRINQSENWMTVINELLRKNHELFDHFVWSLIALNINFEKDNTFWMHELDMNSPEKYRGDKVHYFVSQNFEVFLKLKLNYRQLMRIAILLNRYIEKLNPIHEFQRKELRISILEALFEALDKSESTLISKHLPKMFNKYFELVDNQNTLIAQLKRDPSKTVFFRVLRMKKNGDLTKVSSDLLLEHFSEIVSQLEMNRDEKKRVQNFVLEIKNELFSSQQSTFNFLSLINLDQEKVNVLISQMFGSNNSKSKYILSIYQFLHDLKINYIGKKTPEEIVQIFSRRIINYFKKSRVPFNEFEEALRELTISLPKSDPLKTVFIHTYGELKLIEPIFKKEGKDFKDKVKYARDSELYRFGSHYSMEIIDNPKTNIPAPYHFVDDFHQVMKKIYQDPEIEKKIGKENIKDYTDIADSSVLSIFLDVSKAMVIRDENTKEVVGVGFYKYQGLDKKRRPIYTLGMITAPSFRKGINNNSVIAMYKLFSMLPNFGKEDIVIVATTQNASAERFIRQANPLGEENYLTSVNAKGENQKIDYLYDLAEKSGMPVFKYDEETGTNIYFNERHLMPNKYGLLYVLEPYLLNPISKNIKNAQLDEALFMSNVLPKGDEIYKNKHNEGNACYRLVNEVLIKVDNEELK